MSNRELPILEGLLLFDVLCTLELCLFAVEPDGYFDATIGGKLEQKQHQNSYLLLRNFKIFDLRSYSLSKP